MCLSEGNGLTQVSMLGVGVSHRGTEPMLLLGLLIDINTAHVFVVMVDVLVYE